jgi:hypothetical protein
MCGGDTITTFWFLGGASKKEKPSIWSIMIENLSARKY